MAAEGEELFEATVAELPDLVEYAETSDHAYALAVEAIVSLQEAAQEQGRDFPGPMPSRALVEFSGRVTLRMSTSLHACASRLADQEGVSLNSWIVEAVAARAGRGVAAAASMKTLSAEMVAVSGYTGGVVIQFPTARGWHATSNPLELEEVGWQQRESSNQPGVNREMVYQYQQ